MASEDSESSASFDMLTPDISVSASSQQSETPEAMDESVRELLHDDDLALGRELLMKALDERSDGETGSAPESDESTRVLPRKEVVPDQSGDRLDSDMCIISVGPHFEFYTAHTAVLAQSPLLAAVLKQKQKDSKELVRLRLQDQDPRVFRRILQYLYSQRLPVATSDENERLQQLCEGYIMACQFELDVLQDLILHSLNENKDGIRSDTVLYPAKMVYEADEARLPFREFLRRIVHKSICEEGLDSDNDVKSTLNEFVSCGGTIALDVAEVLMDISQGKNNSCSDELLKGKLQDMKDRNTLLQEEVWKAQIVGNTQSADLERALASAQKQAEAASIVAEVKLESARKQQEDAETASKNQHARAESAEAKLHELTERALGAERDLKDLKNGTGKHRTSKSRKGTKKLVSRAAQTSGLQ